MIRDQFLKHWKVIEAFKDGKQIQCLTSGGDWYDIKVDPIFSLDAEYRIKPEPELQPFDYSDAEFLIGKPVKSKLDPRFETIVSIGVNGLWVQSGYKYFTELLSKYTFLDGSPCGNLME